WFAVAAHELLARARTERWLAASDRTELERAILAIADGCRRGGRHGVRADGDGLLQAGEAGVQMTWMDAIAGGRVVTPRVGKPVEVQALWYNVLCAAAAIDASWQSRAERTAAAFRARFWNAARGCLFDVVDDGHVAGAVDGRLRPNQLLA